MEHCSFSTVVIIESFTISGRIGDVSLDVLRMSMDQHCRFQVICLSINEEISLFLIEEINEFRNIFSKEIPVVRRILRQRQKFCFLFSVFYSQLQLCSNASWNENASIFASQSIIDLKAAGLFIDRQDQIYVAYYFYGRILAWTPGNANAHRNFSLPIFDYSDLFIVMNGSIFFQVRNESARIEKWSIDRNERVFVAKFDGHCWSLLIGMNSSLYRSRREQYKVMKISINSEERNGSVMVADRILRIECKSIARPVGHFFQSSFQRVYRRFGEQ